MLYSIIKNAYRWFFLLTREAQYLAERTKNTKNPFSKQYIEKAESLKEFCLRLYEKIDPVEQERHQRMKSMLFPQP